MSPTRRSKLTATSFINHTLEGLLTLCQKAFIILIGPTSPLSPILFDYGIDAICGSKVIDPDKVIRSISEGAMFKEVNGVKLLTLTKTSSGEEICLSGVPDVARK